MDDIYEVNSACEALVQLVMATHIFLFQKDTIYYPLLDMGRAQVSDTEQKSVDSSRMCCQLFPN